MVDISGWAGLSKYLPAKSVISSLPFISSFNTGQGQHWFVAGKSSGSGWTDISRQDIAPSWQFAVFGSAKVAVNYDFDQAWQGGSSLLLETTTAGDADIPLYQTQLRLGESSKLRLVFQPQTGTTSSALNQVQLYLQFADGQRESIPLIGTNIGNSQWQQLSVALPQLAGRELVRIGLQWPTGAKPDFRLGQLELLP